MWRALQPGGPGHVVTTFYSHCPLGSFVLKLAEVSVGTDSQLMSGKLQPRDKAVSLGGEERVSPQPLGLGTGACRSAAHVGRKGAFSIAAQQGVLCSKLNGVR